MKRLIIRIGVFGFIAGMVGMIAFAQVQQNNGNNDEQQAAASPLRNAPPTSPVSEENPLRNDAPPSAASAPVPLREIPNAPAAFRDLPEPSPGDRSLSSTSPTGPSSTPADPPASGEKTSLNDPFAGAGRTAIPISSQNPEASRVVQLTGAAAEQSSPQLSGPLMPQPAADQEPKRIPPDPFAQPMSNSPPPREFTMPNLQADSPVSAPASKEGTGQPGGKQLEGPQSPQLTLQKFTPPEIQVGKPAVFKVTVQNTGRIPASQVEIRDQVPRGTQLLKTSPRASENAQGEIVWTLGMLQPGETASVEMELLPTAEGEIGSVASVHFTAEASAKTVCTRPQLVIETAGPGEVLIGDSVTLSITISNPGSGVATGVMLEERLPPGLQHPSGNELEYPVGNLRPGESKRLQLQLTATAPGRIDNVLTARADGNLRTEDRLALEVMAPKLDLVAEGPKRRYLEREATYQFSVSNPGTASAEQVLLTAYLPPGLKFVSANNSGQYVEADRAVYWRLEELPSNQTGTVELITMPVEAGQQSIILRGTAQKGLNVQKEQAVMVEGIAAILFQVADAADPIEVGGEATYEVHVLNQGSKAASNVQLAVILPPELQFLSAEGPARYAVQGNQVIFEGLARLSPKSDTTYRVRVKGLRPGDLRTRFQLLTGEMQTPVLKEESTRVYADE
ncbi:MAG: DUF11 domain-containing protein [Pirellulales bacterium]|nr:DUF11 domain-containing protein [Pirellulales bacterium]